MDSSHPGPNEGVAVIQGIIDPLGEQLVELKSVRYYATRSSPLATQQNSGRFRAEVASAMGEVTTVSYDALVADDSFPGITQHGLFEVTVPVNDKIASIFISDATRSKVFARIDVQAGLPSRDGSRRGVSGGKIEKK